MTRLLSILLLIPLSLALSLSAQADLQQRFRAAIELCTEGHFEEATEVARLVLDSAQLTQTDRGKAYIILGSALQHQGKFQEAMTAYENAIQILKGRDESVADYASALSLLGSLLRDMRQFDAAAQMELHALQVDRQIDNHEGIAVDCASLADLELGLKHTRKAQAWLDKAMKESQLAPALDDAFYAFITSSQAWLAQLRGHERAAVDGYAKEIGYLTHSYGDENPQVGWAYMLLGKAHLNEGNVSDALINMRKGRAILGETVGTNNPRFLLAQVEYAQALESYGLRAEAIQIRSDAETKLKAFYQEQCVDCRITAMALH